MDLEGGSDCVLRESRRMHASGGYNRHPPTVRSDRPSDWLPQHSTVIVEELGSTKFRVRTLLTSVGMLKFYQQLYAISELFSPSFIYSHAVS